MGHWHKNDVEDSGKHELASLIAAKAGAIEECESHPGSFVYMDDPDAEIAAVESARGIFSGESAESRECRKIFKSAEELEEMVRQVIDEADDMCPQCARWAD